MLFLVGLCNTGFHSADVQKMCPTPSTNQPSKFAQLLQLRLGELPRLDVRLRRNEGGIVGGCFNEIQWYQTHTVTYLHYIIISLYIHYIHIFQKTMAPKIGDNDLLIVFAALFSTCFFQLIWWYLLQTLLQFNIHYSDRNYQYHPVQWCSKHETWKIWKISESIWKCSCHNHGNQMLKPKVSNIIFPSTTETPNPPILERSAGSGSFRSTCQPPPIRTYKSWILACYSEHCNTVGSSPRVGLLEIVVNLFFGLRKLQKSSVLSSHMESIPRLPWKSSPHFG